MSMPTEVADARALLLSHPLYDGRLVSLAALRTFMEHHVWAVWDFMSLVTRLQRDLTGVGVPWLPPEAPPKVVRFINEIKVGEESDDVPTWGTGSHLSLYLAAMSAVGADQRPMLATCAALRHVPTADVASVAEATGAPPGAARFVRSTMRMATHGSLPEVAGAFAYGRETLIPDLFRPLIDAHHECAMLDLYLARHIEVDGDAHGPMAKALVDAACHTAEDQGAAHAGAFIALQARLGLWSATLAALDG